MCGRTYLVPDVHVAVHAPLRHLASVLVSHVLEVGGVLSLDLVDPETTNESTGDADVHADLTPEVRCLCLVVSSSCTCSIVPLA
jgi:hypothetical protein